MLSFLEFDMQFAWYGIHVLIRQLSHVKVSSQNQVSAANDFFAFNRNKEPEK